MPPKENESSPPFVIPHESPRRAYWSSAIFLLDIYYTLVIPVRICFDQTDWKNWIGVDIATDLFLYVDIVINFLTTFEHQGEIISSRPMIASRYLHSWLFPDLLAAFPFEVIAIGLRTYYPLYRINHLLRLGRFGSYFLSWEKVSSLKPSVIRIFKSVYVILILAHWLGCVFFLIVYLEGADALIDFVGSDSLVTMPLRSQYLNSFYWSFVTMTGYNNTNPNTTIEAAFSIFVTVVGITLFATLIGTVGSLVTNLDSSKLYFRQKMDSINDYMAYKNIPANLQIEVRGYYTYLWKSGKGLGKNQVLEDLPPYLKNKMNVFMNREIISKVPMFKDCANDEEFITEVVKCLKGRVCLPNTFVVKRGEIGTEMYFVSRGELNVVAESNAVVFTIVDGGFFGEIALLYDTKRTASIVARTYCDMFILTKEDFKKVMRKFPEQSRGIKEIARERFQKIVDEEKKKEAAAKAAKAQVNAQASALAAVSILTGKAAPAPNGTPPAADSKQGEDKEMSQVKSPS